MPESIQAPLHSFTILPSAGLKNYPASIPASLAFSVPIGYGQAQRITVARSVRHKCWLEVQPVLPVTVESIRAALVQSESRFEVQEFVRQQALTQARQQQLEAQWEREAANAARRGGGREYRHPSGAGLARGPTVINTTTRSAARPVDNSSCPNVQAYNWAMGQGPKPPDLISATMTRRK